MLTVRSVLIGLAAFAITVLVILSHHWAAGSGTVA
jgi:hypothetical protein